MLRKKTTASAGDTNTNLKYERNVVIEEGNIKLG